MHLQNKQQHVFSATLTLGEGRKSIIFGGIVSQSHIQAHQGDSDFDQFQKPVSHQSGGALERMHEMFFISHLSFYDLLSLAYKELRINSKMFFMFSKWYQFSHGQLPAYY